AQKGGSPLCRAGTHGSLAVRRANHGGGLALQAELVCGLETRSDDRARSGAVPGGAHEGDHRGARCGSSLPGVPPPGDRRSDPHRRRPRQVAGRHAMRIDDIARWLSRAALAAAIVMPLWGLGVVLRQPVAAGFAASATIWIALLLISAFWQLRGSFTAMAALALATAVVS